MSQLPSAGGAPVPFERGAPAVTVLEVGAILLAAAAAKRLLPIGLGQIGEFGFVLATVAVARGVLPGEVYAALLAAVAISIGASSILVRIVRPMTLPAAA